MITFSKATPSERKRYLEQRWQDLKIVRDRHATRWRDVERYVSPDSARFDIHNHGEDRDRSYIYDSTATLSLDILASGMMSSASSPSRSWFSLTTTNPALKDDHQVLLWLKQLEQALARTFDLTNTYMVLHQMYRDLALYGVSANLITEDYNSILAHHLLPCGEYAIASNIKGEVDTLYREFELTAIQAIKAFGYDNVSRDIQKCYQDGNLQQYFSFIHAIEPREDRDLNSLKSIDKKWASYYYEQGQGQDGIVSESGFNYFPCVVPRWEVIGADPYGTSPCLKLLPDIMQLQQETYRKLELIDQIAHPALQVPQSARNEQISLQAGALNYVASTDNSNSIKPMLANNVDGNIGVISNDIQDLRERIKEGLFVKQFLLLEDVANNRKTTVEVYALKEEKMLALGSVSERINNECLKPFVTIGLNRLLESGAMPQPPKQIQDALLEVEFESVLAQAQKAIDLNAVDRFVSTVYNSVSVMPEVLDRIDPDGLIDVYKDRIGVDPKVLRSIEQAGEIRKQRAEQQQAQQEAMQQAQQAQAINQLAQASEHGTQASLANQQLNGAIDSLGL